MMAGRSGEANGDDGRNGESALDALCRATVHLIESLPTRPTRLRLSTDDVIVDLDWRPNAPEAEHVAADVARGAPEDAAVPEHRTRSSAPVLSADEPDLDLHYVLAPSVGTFYHAADPGAAPFVNAGQSVEEGQQVGIIEAMKMMLPIEADRAGVVVAVLVDDSQPVEYGERVLSVRPS